MKKWLGGFLLLFCVGLCFASPVQAEDLPFGRQVAAITDQTRLETIVDSSQSEGVTGWPLKKAIVSAVRNGVSVNTVVLLILFPMTATVVALSRQVLGVNGFGIFTSALVSVAFLSTGILAGLVLFIAIIVAATIARVLIGKIHLPYLPRMAMLIWAVALSVLLLLISTPYVNLDRLTSIGIFPVLLFVLLAESFLEAQVTRTWQAAALMTAETIVIALVGYLLMSLRPLQAWALSNPELAVISVFGLNYLIAKYKGLRLLEIWRFRKIIHS